MSNILAILLTWYFKILSWDKKKDQKRKGGEDWVLHICQEMYTLFHWIILFLIVIVHLFIQPCGFSEFWFESEHPYSEEGMNTSFPHMCHLHQQEWKGSCRKPLLFTSSTPSLHSFTPPMWMHRDYPLWTSLSEKRLSIPSEMPPFLRFP